MITNRPNDVNLELRLAEAAYQAGDVRQGDLAAAKAVSLAPAAQRAALRKAFAQLKKNPSGSSTSPTTATPTTATGAPAATAPATTAPTPAPAKTPKKG